MRLHSFHAFSLLSGIFRTFSCQGFKILNIVHVVIPITLKQADHKGPWTSCIIFVLGPLPTDYIVHSLEYVEYNLYRLISDMCLKPFDSLYNLSTAGCARDWDYQQGSVTSLRKSWICPGQETISILPQWRGCITVKTLVAMIIFFFFFILSF